MIDNPSLILLLFGYFIFLYFFVDYFKVRFKDKYKLSEEFDLFFITSALITILFFASILMQADLTVQNNILAGWISFVIISVCPFTYLIIVNFIKKYLNALKKRNVVREHEDD